MTFDFQESGFLGMLPYSAASGGYIGLFQLDTPDPTPSNYYGDMQITPRRRAIQSRPIESRRNIFDRDKLRELIILERELSIEEEDEIVLLAMALL